LSANAIIVVTLLRQVGARPDEIGRALLHSANRAPLVVVLDAAA
jgi:hypothetical protein